MSDRVFMIGTSAGGVAALHSIIENLDPHFKSPVIVVQHLPDVKHVDVKTVYPAAEGRFVLEAEDKMPVEDHHVYFAPGGYHLLIEKDECFSLNQDEPIRYSRPSIDLSFETAAKAFGRRLVGVVLTGANADGAAGLQAVRAAGGVCIVQNPQNAEYSEMPQASMDAVKPDHVVQIEEIPPLFRKIEAGQ